MAANQGSKDWQESEYKYVMHAPDLGALKAKHPMATLALRASVRPAAAASAACRAAEHPHASALRPAPDQTNMPLFSSCTQCRDCGVPAPARPTAPSRLPLAAALVAGPVPDAIAVAVATA